MNHDTSIDPSAASRLPWVTPELKHQSVDATAANPGASSDGEISAFRPSVDV